MEFSFACKNIPSAAHFQRIQIIRADWDCWHSFKCIYRRICYSLFHSACEFLVLVLHNVSICLLRILFTHISNATIHGYSLARFFCLRPYAQPDIFSSLHQFFIFFLILNSKYHMSVFFWFFLLLATEKKITKQEMYEQINVEEKILRE